MVCQEKIMSNTTRFIPFQLQSILDACLKMNRRYDRPLRWRVIISEKGIAPARPHGRSGDAAREGVTPERGARLERDAGEGAYRPRQQCRQSCSSGRPIAAIIASMWRYAREVTFRSFRIHSTMFR